MKLFDRLIDHIVDRVQARIDKTRKQRTNITTNSGRGIEYAAQVLAGNAGREFSEALKRGQAKQVVADTTGLKRSIEADLSATDVQHPPEAI